MEVIVGHESARQLLGALQAGELDVGFVKIVDPEAIRDLTFVTIEQDEVAVALPPGHRLSDRPQLTFTELCDEPFVAYAPESGMYDALCALQVATGREASVAIRSRSTRLVRSLVSEGLGVSIGNKRYLESAGPPITVIPLGPTPIRTSIVLAMRAEIESNPAGRAFVEFIRQRVGE
jgi:DNA-binding transcriptional LysR family regulator